MCPKSHVPMCMFEPTNPHSCSKGSLSIFRYLSTVLMLYFTSVILSYSYYYTCYVLIYILNYCADIMLYYCYIIILLLFYLLLY